MANRPAMTPAAALLPDGQADPVGTAAGLAHGTQQRAIRVPVSSLPKQDQTAQDAPSCEPVCILSMDFEPDCIAPLS
jgi:hypothetical protein